MKLKGFTLKSKIIAVIILLQCVFFVKAQPVINVVTNVNNRSLVSGSSLGMPTAASSSATMSFSIKNAGSSNLILTGSPAVLIAGSGDFTISQPGTVTIVPGGSTNFSLTYTATSTGIKSATLTIPNNAGPNFIIPVNGPVFNLYGPKFPPSGTISSDAIGNPGRTGGKSFLITSVSLPLRTSTWWAPSINSQGELQLKVSLNGGEPYSPDEILSWSSSESNLPNGISIWRGKTFIANAITGNFNVPVFIRARLTTKNASNAIIPLVNPTTLGLSEQIGGLVSFTGISDYLVANYFIEASLDNVNFQPYLDFYDAYPTPIGNPPGTSGPAFSSINHGFYWINTSPTLSANSPLVLNEGATATIGTSILNAIDDEDLPANPQNIVFSFATTGPGNSPLVFNNGSLRKNGIPLLRSETFTLKNIQDGVISYAHNGSETTFDQFQFSFKDSKNAIGFDGPNSIYSFNIQITPVNDPPVSYDSSFTFSYAVPSNGQLRGSDAENQSLTYSVVTNPAKGTINMNSSTGAFVYTPFVNTIPGSDVFTFRTFDGTSFSNNATVNINLINLAPVVPVQSFATKEGQALNDLIAATDPEGTAVTFQLNTNATKGNVIIQPGGSFVYTPNANLFGPDSFSIIASDAGGTTSAPQVINLRIIPNLDPGDILIADKNLLRIFDPQINADTTIAKNMGLQSAQNLVYKKNSSIFVLDSDNGLIRINPVSASQTLVVPRSSFSPNPGPLGITFNQAGNVIIADGTNGIVKVDTSTNILSSLHSGGNLGFSTAVLYMSNGDLLVSDATAFVGGTSKIIRISPAGVQTVISLGGLLVVPVDFAFIDENNIVVANAGSFVGGTDNILKVNLNTGAQSVISSGGLLSVPFGLDYYHNNLYVVNNQGARHLLKIDVNTGNQTILPISNLGGPFGLMVVPDDVVPTPVATVTSQPDCLTPTGTIVITAPIEAGMTYSVGGPYQSGLTFGSLTPGTYLVTAKNLSGVISQPLSLEVLPQPIVPAPPIVSGIVNICPYVGTGDPVTYTFTSLGATAYNYSLPPNINLVSSTVNSITVTFASGFASQANKQIKVTASSTCGTSLQTIFYLLGQLPTTPQSISASSENICPVIGTNTPITFTIPKVLAATSYIWSAQTGNTVITHPNGPGVNDTIITVTFGSGFTTSAITVRSVNVCGTSSARSILVTRNNPSTPSLLSGPTNVCEYIAPGGTVATYSVPAVAGVTYTWNVPAGAIGLTGQGTNSISFSFPNGFTNGSVSVSGSNGCGNSGLRSLNVSALNPATPGIIDVIQVQSCPNRQYSYTIAAVPSNSTGLTWTIPIGATLVSGNGTRSIVVSYPPTALIGSVTVTGTSNCGSGSTRSTPVKLPACPPTFAGKGTVVPGKTSSLITDNEKNLDIRVYPNPTSNIFRVNLQMTEITNISARLLDIQGRILEQWRNLKGSEFGFGEKLLPGTYFLEIQQGQRKFTKKLVKF